MNDISEKLAMIRIGIEESQHDYRIYNEILLKELVEIQRQIYDGDTTGDKILDYTFLNYNPFISFEKNYEQKNDLIKTIKLGKNQPFFAFFSTADNNTWYFGIVKDEPILDNQHNVLTIPVYGLVTQHLNDVVTLPEKEFNISKTYFNYRQKFPSLEEYDEFGITFGTKNVTKSIVQSSKLTLDYLANLIFDA
ncbi:hypothetical protein JXM83_02265 [Candidatus Woesearchaeota archaeon]|nr:hypothetical protein [Candidatus Woesearchaeota archaeon]